MNPSRILVVEDDPIVLKFICANLKTCSYDVMAAEDGESALEMMKQSPADLVILDIIMPGIDGFEVCRPIREWSKVPVIILFAKTSMVDRLMAFETGADDYIAKPFAVDELIARVKSLLRRVDNHEPAVEMKTDVANT